MGPFSKGTFETARLVTQGIPAVWPSKARCVLQASLSLRMPQKNIPAWHAQYSEHTQKKKNNTHTHTHTQTQRTQFLPCCLSCGARKRSMLRIHWNHLQELRPGFVPPGHLKGNVFRDKNKWMSMTEDWDKPSRLNPVFLVILARVFSAFFFWPRGGNKLIFFGNITASGSNICDWMKRYPVQR